jgi:hypothetical protein
MANYRVIVDVVTRITPEVPKPTDRAFDASPDGFRVEFRNGQIARLFRSSFAAALLDLLDDLREQEAPAYVEVEGDANAITQLRLPGIRKVQEVREMASGEVDVVLFPSHARHTLSRKNEAFDALLKALLESNHRDQWQLVTETDSHEIIDVRPFGPDAPELPRVPGWFERLRSLLFEEWWLRLRLWCYWLCCRSGCVSMKTAWDMFDLVAPTSCNPTNPLAPCIPFRYPDDGCWARAHEMCRLMIAAGVTPAKVWIDYAPPTFLHAATRNHWQCFVEWGWHVAPTLCVRGYLCARETYVIDPSLFTGPVLVATWQAAQGGPNTTLTHTSASVYWRNYIPTDPAYVDTNFRLTTYRNALKYRSTLEINPATNMPWGPPPYANCP